MSSSPKARVTEDEITENMDEAEKVEESLRDFISKIVAYYEKFGINNESLSNFEDKISSSETLLEVFDVMKDMVEELMYQVSNEGGGLVNNSSLGMANMQGQKIEKILHKYESEIRTHVKMEQEFKVMAEQADKHVETLKINQKNLEEKLRQKQNELDEAKELNKKLINHFNIDQKSFKFTKKETQELRLRLEKLNNIEAPMSSTHSSLCVPSKKKNQSGQNGKTVFAQVKQTRIQRHTKNKSECNFREILGSNGLNAKVSKRNLNNENGKNTTNNRTIFQQFLKQKKVFS